MADEKLPLSRRLNQSRQFDQVFQNNQYRVSTPELLILAVGNHLNQSRLGMVISKKVTAKAAGRNHIKRHIREVFRRFDLPYIDVVVVSRKNINKHTQQRLATCLHEAFSALKGKTEQ